MARVGGRDGERGRTATPDSIPDVPPSPTPYTADFTFTAVMELQKNVAVLVEKVDRLSQDSKDLSDKVDRLRRWQAAILGGALVLAFFWSALQLVPWDRIKIDPSPSSSGTSSNAS